MIDRGKNMSCHEFQEQLAEMIGSGVNVANHPHLQSCALCRALLADLESIASAARDLFPVEDPSDRVWDQIRSAIEEEQGRPSSK